MSDLNQAIHKLNSMTLHKAKTKTRGACAPISCNDCGIFQLCYSVGGDTDLSALDTLVKNRKTIKRGEFLFRPGEPARTFFAIRSGSIKTFTLADDGAVQVIGFYFTGEVLGLDAIATGRYNCAAVALETTSVCEVPFGLVGELSRSIPDLQYSMMQILGNEIHHCHELMMLLGKKSAEERLSTFLLDMSSRLEKRNFSPTQFNLSMSRSDIGNYLGMAEETVCRVFTRFQNEELITTRRRQITLNDSGRIKAIARRK